MKLFATTTTERATKGQGGNKRLDIEVVYGSKQQQLKACSVYIQANSDDTFTMTIIDNNNSTLLHTILPTKSLKGEKKKGEYYRLTSCIHCKQRIEEYTKTAKEPLCCPCCRLKQ